MTPTHTPSPPQRLLTAPEAAKYLGIGVTKLNELRRAKKIPTVRFMADARFDIVDLDAFIDAQHRWGLYSPRSSA